MYHNFINECLKGEISLQDLDNYVDQWHEDEGNDQSLQEFLGLTTFEYTLWLQQDSNDVFEDILHCRENHQTLEEFYAHPISVEVKTDFNKQNSRLLVE